MTDIPPIDGMPAALPALAPVPAVPPSIKDAVLEQFKQTESAIVALAEKYRAVAYDCTTTKGMAEAVAARADVRDNGVYALTRAEKVVRRDVNDLKRLMGDEVDRLVAIVTPVLVAIDAQIEAEKKRREAIKAERDRIEKERIAGHHASMATIGDYLARCQQPGMTAERIQAGIDALAAATFGPEWQEYAARAADAQRETLDAMRRLHDAAVEREAEALRIEAARQAEAARLEAQRAEQARVAAEQEKVRAEQAEAARVLADQAAEVKRQTQEIADKQAEMAQLEKLAEDRRAAAAAPPPAPAPEPAPPPAAEPMMQDVDAGLPRARAGVRRYGRHAVEAAAAIATPPEPAPQPTPTLADRLRAHAAMHREMDYFGDKEQLMFADDLEAAASGLERYRAALAEVQFKAVSLADAQVIALEALDVGNTK